MEVEFDEQMPQGGTFVNHGLSAVKKLKITGINEAAELGMNISVFPNPSTGVFQISNSDSPPAGGLSEFGWKVTDTHGSVVALGNDEIKDFTIDLSTHPKGIYYLKIIQGKLQTVRKLVVQ